MTTRLLRIAAISGAALLFALPASAGRSRGERWEGREIRGESGIPRRFERLGLTPEQRERIRTILAEQRERIEPLRRELREERREARRGSPPDRFDEKLFRERFREKGRLHEEIAVARARGHARILDLLDPGQRERLAEMRGEERERRRGEMRRHRPGARPGTF
jgi:Spy/CpxP family protein refolding chaperone